jgi:hypothetical protein
MSRIGGGTDDLFPVELTLVLNTDHTAVARLTADGVDEEKVQTVARHLYEWAVGHGTLDADAGRVSGPFRDLARRMAGLMEKETLWMDQNTRVRRIYSVNGRFRRGSQCIAARPARQHGDCRPEPSDLHRYDLSGMTAGITPRHGPLCFQTAC